MRSNSVAQKKHDRGCGRPRMRYAASEKLEIIRLVEGSHLSARQTLAKLDICLTPQGVEAVRHVALQRARTYCGADGSNTILRRDPVASA